MKPGSPCIPAASGRSAAADNRGSSRHDYRFVQKIAPLRNGTMPTAGDFFDVVCCDLARGGVSFFLATPPDFDEVVVALGRAPKINRLLAKVVHIEQLSIDGGVRYRVGCRFTERLGF